MLGGKNENKHKLKGCKSRDSGSTRASNFCPRQSYLSSMSGNYGIEPSMPDAKNQVLKSDLKPQWVCALWSQSHAHLLLSPSHHAAQCNSLQLLVFSQEKLGAGTAGVIGSN